MQTLSYQQQLLEVEHWQLIGSASQTLLLLFPFPHSCRFLKMLGSVGKLLQDELPSSCPARVGVLVVL
jgi:hypothetical protein